MDRTSSNHRMNRRTFLRAGALGTAAAVGGGVIAGAQAPPLDASVYRTLGRTGLKVTSVSIGTFRTTEPAVIRKAFEAGVNYLDTARSYHNGNNEAYVGEALKGWPDKVYVSTKVVLDSKEKMVQSIDTSLSKLGVDCIDILFMHHLSTKEEVLNEDAREVLVNARDQGKVRFLGVSTHKNEVDVLDTMIEDKLFDVAMVVYNFKSADVLTKAIERATAAGIGIVAMKTMAGGYKTKELGDISPYQAALKWVLQNPNIHATVPSMVDLGQIKENTALMRKDLAMSSAESRALERYGQAIAPYYCLRCGACEATCPYGVDIPTINRCLMYAEGYRDLDAARTAYAGLRSDRSIAACADCSTCVAQCPNGITIASQVHRAKTLLA